MGPPGPGPTPRRGPADPVHGAACCQRGAARCGAACRCWCRPLAFPSTALPGGPPCLSPTDERSSSGREMILARCRSLLRRQAAGSALVCLALPRPDATRPAAVTAPTQDQAGPTSAAKLKKNNREKQLPRYIRACYTALARFLV